MWIWEYTSKRQLLHLQMIYRQKQSTDLQFFLLCIFHFFFTIFNGWEAMSSINQFSLLLLALFGSRLSETLFHVFLGEMQRTPWTGLLLANEGVDIEEGLPSQHVMWSENVFLNYCFCGEKFGQYCCNRGGFFFSPIKSRLSLVLIWIDCQKMCVLSIKLTI